MPDDTSAEQIVWSHEAQSSSLHPGEDETRAEAKCKKAQEKATCFQGVALAAAMVLDQGQSLLKKVSECTKLLATEGIVPASLHV